MADPIGAFRTNYFRVTNGTRFMQLFRYLTSDDRVMLFTDRKTADGEQLYGFGAYGSSLDAYELPLENEDVRDILESGGTVYDDSGNPFTLETVETVRQSVLSSDPLGENVIYDARENDCGLDGFLKALQKILPDGEVFVLYETSREKLNYVHGDVYVMTNRDIEFKSLSEIARDTARALTGNSELVLADTY